jgi:hypothetical protein
MSGPLQAPILAYLSSACALLLAFRIKLAMCQELAMHFESVEHHLRQNGTIVKGKAVCLIEDCMVKICKSAPELPPYDPLDPMGGYEHCAATNYIMSMLTS